MKKGRKKETLRKLTGYSKKEAKIVLGFLKVNKKARIKQAHTSKSK